MEVKLHGNNELVVICHVIDNAAHRGVILQNSRICRPQFVIHLNLSLTKFGKLLDYGTLALVPNTHLSTTF